MEPELSFEVNEVICDLSTPEPILLIEIKGVTPDGRNVWITKLFGQKHFVGLDPSIASKDNPVLNPILWSYAEALMTALWNAGVRPHWRRDMSKKRKVAFICGPYRAANKAQRDFNIALAGIVAQLLWSKGWAVLCPHTNSSQFDDAVSEAEADYAGGYIELLRRIKPNALFVLPGYKDSNGSIIEISISESMQIKQAIIYLGITPATDIKYLGMTMLEVQNAILRR